MVYTERNQLAVIELQREQDTLPYEALFQILTDRPSLAVYVELNGLLYGMITLGRVRRAWENHLDCVEINRHYSSIGADEAMRARKTFYQGRNGAERRKNIQVLPVVDAGGRLLGDYTGMDGLLSMEYALSLLKGINAAPFVKRGFRLVLVSPRRDLPKRRRQFLKLKEILEEKGILAETVEFSQVPDRAGSADYILFCDEGELNTARLLLDCVPGNEKNSRRASLILYQRFAALLSDSTFEILEALQEQGVYVLTFAFEEDESGFLKSLNNQIENRRRRAGRNLCAGLTPEIRDEFLLELREQYADQKLPLECSFHIQDGVIQPRDASTPFFHFEYGLRRTTGQPECYERRVCMFGRCLVVGTYTDDRHTVPSLLQEKLNRGGPRCKVENWGAIENSRGMGTEAMLSRLLTAPLRQGDVVVLDKINSNLRLGDVPNLNLTDSLRRRQVPETWFIDSVLHCNHRVNEIIAESVCEALLPVLRRPAKDRRPVREDRDPVRQLYLDRYFHDFDRAAYETVGSIVMNCNPFTFGHRHLIETALEQVDFLIIFVLDEDLSLFSFEERFAMVCAGTADLERVRVVPSGSFILSNMTFPEYFIKETDEEVEENTENDVRLFAEKIAPRLGITHRFAGEEPEDPVTNIYNQAMRRILPAYGIRLVEIPRKKSGEEIVSASRVRKYLEENDLDRLSMFVPDSTKKILFYENK